MPLLPFYRTRLNYLLSTIYLWYAGEAKPYLRPVKFTKLPAGAELVWMDYTYYNTKVEGREIPPGYMSCMRVSETQLKLLKVPPDTIEFGVGIGNSLSSIERIFDDIW